MRIKLSLILAIAVLINMLFISNFAFAESGFAVHYSNKFQGKKTANGEIFDQNGLTAAHKKFPYGTQVKVTNLENDRSVIVKINDRMRTRNRNVIDVTKRAAEELGFVKEGRARVSLEVVN
ncbi:MAG: septal ring lytic transglycosylase RlpA family protein [Nitrosomonas sp. PRO4]|nr:septal ring lytic transglycosylase RlpA family protein [Nitrosomonas sp. PRO4]